MMTISRSSNARPRLGEWLLVRWRVCVELSLLDWAKRYRRLALLFAEEDKSKHREANMRLGAVHRYGEEDVNRTLKTEAAD